MRTVAILAAAGLSGALVGCAASQPRQTQVPAVACGRLSDTQTQVATLLAPNNVLRVEPTYHEQVHVSSTLPLYVSGARIYVPAEAGVNQAYLERALSCHAASSTDGAAAHPNDPLRVEGVRAIDVRPAGQSFAIAITGVDRESGAEIWERAQALRGGGIRIEVEQLSALRGSAL